MRGGTPIVVKLGGAGAAAPATAASLAGEIGRLVGEGEDVVVVHGGGQQLNALTTRLGLASRVVGGRRVTDDETLKAATMAFAGEVGTSLAAAFHGAGVKAASLSGVDGGLLQVVRRPPVRLPETGDTVDFGWVGDVTGVDPSVLKALLAARIVPLVASLGVDREGRVYNVNADTVAAWIAASLAARLVLLTDVGGVYQDVAAPDSLIRSLSRSELEGLLRSGVAAGGMAPKLHAVTAALTHGAASVRIAGWGGAAAPLGAALAGLTGTGIS